MPEHPYIPNSCPTGAADCLIGEECWACLSLCCDPCSEYKRRPPQLQSSIPNCPIDPAWLLPELPPASPWRPSYAGQRPDVESPRTQPPAVPSTSPSLVQAIETTTTTTPVVATTPRPRDCGNSRRTTKASECFSPVFGGTISPFCGGLERELADSVLALGSDERLHLIEECDDANNFPGDGCSKECTVEEGFVCTETSATKYDICVPDQPRGVLKVLLSKGSLEGFATWAYVDPQDDLSPHAGYFKMSLQPHAHAVDVDGLFATSRWGAIFTREVNSVVRHAPEQELWNCACTGELEIRTSMNGSYSGDRKFVILC